MLFAMEDTETKGLLWEGKKGEIISSSCIGKPEGVALKKGQIKTEGMDKKGTQAEKKIQ